MTLLWLSRFVGSGSKAEKLNASKCFPLCPQEQTSSDRFGMPVSLPIAAIGTAHMGWYSLRWPTR
jgi:hypothetical protein